jgi:hypothetical protein
MLEFVKNYLGKNFDEYYTRKQVCEILECNNEELAKYSLNSNTQNSMTF